MPTLLSGLVLLLAGIPNGEAVDDDINAALKESKAPGASVIAVKNGKVMLEKGYGLANVEHKVPMTKDSVHELASVSKQFTAVAILRLAQDGRLKLDDNLLKFFPNQGDAWRKVTVLHLLHHTSGLPDYLGALGDLGREWTKKEMVDAIGKKPLRFEPDSKWEYSNSGYMLLGLIVEEASRESLGTFLEKTFYGPLGMKSSRLNTMQQVVAGRADGYDQGRNGVWIRESATSESLCATGDGEVMSTVGDLWKWNDALHNGRVLDAAHYKILTTPSKASVDHGQGYGCGIIILDRNGSKVYVHGGGWTGTSTIVLYNKTANFFYAVLCNMGGADTQPIENVLRKHFSASKPDPSPAAQL